MRKALPSIQETQETQVRSLGWEDPLEKGMATHFSILAGKIPWTEEPDGPPQGHKEPDMNDVTEHTHTHTHTYIYIYLNIYIYNIYL